jgi:hypothetical protein
VHRATTPTTTSRAGLLLIAYLAFVGLGLPDAVTGMTWPSIRDTFGRGRAASA